MNKDILRTAFRYITDKERDAGPFKTRALWNSLLQRLAIILIQPPILHLKKKGYMVYLS